MLIHGSCSNSAAWFADIPVLAGQYHVFSVEVVGDAGNSEGSRLDQTTDEFESWLAEVFNGLGIEKAVLIAPSGIMPTSLFFVVKTILYLMMGEKGRKALNKMIFGNDEIPEEVANFTRLIGDNFNLLTGATPTLTDDQVRKLTMPLLLIAGENDTLTNAVKGAARLKTLKPHAEIHTIKNNSTRQGAAFTCSLHFQPELNFNVPDRCINHCREKIRRFIGGG